MRRIALFVSISALALALLPTGPVQAAGGADPEVIPGSYIVVLKSGAPGSVAAEHSRRHNTSVQHVYTHALRGYAARMSARAAANIARDPRVDYVEPDGVVTASATTQDNATWGLDRIDQQELPLSTTYSYDANGAGVTAYVIDTGIRASHTEFTGRMATGATAIADGRGTDDCNGHGTHVAGTIGGTTWGVAKGVSLAPVRVLDCNGSGTWSGVIAGLDWVTANAAKPAVANMSLGGGANSSVDAAVETTIASGVSVAVAAGNGNRGGKEQDACGYSPARVPAAITIGATTSSDAKTSWSNYGDCVDWFAPGASITSAWSDGDNAIKTISGTSMAAPHVAGAAALYLQGDPNASPHTVRETLYAATTKNIVSNSKTSDNHLLYTGTESSGGGSEDPPNTPPTVEITAPADGSSSIEGDSVSFSGSASDTEDGNLSGSLIWTSSQDGQIGTGASFSTSTLTASTHTITASVTDSGGLADSDQITITVEEAPPGGDDGGGTDSGFALSVTAYKVKGWQQADLTWSGATSTDVDVFRNGTRIATTANDGAYTDDAIGIKGGGMSHTYQVCEAGTSTCSNVATATF